MADRLPSLTALRAFEAAARHMSFAQAAHELSVTPAALSFQIKSLEEHLGEPVFRRLNRAVELTEAGKTLAPGVTDGFERLTAAWRATLRLQQGTSLTVSAGPAFTAKWLAPRMYEFAQKHPEIELRLAASLRRMDFMRDDVDIAIRFGYPEDEGLFALPLMRECSMPVMTPALAAKFTTPQSLAEAPLLHDDSAAFLNPPVDWQAWFTATNVAGTPKSGPRFSQADHAIDAALSGAGVLLARSSVLARLLSDGQLVAPFQTVLTSKAEYRFLCAKGTESQPKIASFLRWMQDEIAAYPVVEEGKTIVPVEQVMSK